MEREKILLIYSFGNSDLAFNGEETFPRGSYRDFRAHLEVLKPLLEGSQKGIEPLKLAGEALPSGLDFTSLPPNRRKTQRNQQEFIIETVRFPILFDVLQGLFTDLSQGNDRSLAEMHLQPIVTDQEPPHPQDTVDIIPLLRVYIEFLNDHWRQADNRLQLRLGKPWILDVVVSDYDSLLEPYGQFYEGLQSALAGSEQAYFSLTTGTPAMSFAAGSVFASDPRITFIYKPRGAPALTHVSTFRDRVRQETLGRLRTLLERLDFRGALEVVQAERNGFAADETAMASSLLEALDAWQNYDFQRAAGIAQTLTSLNVSSLQPFRELCECLAQDDPAFDGRARFWRMKIVDTLMRLEIAIYRRDLPDVLYQFYNYNDVCLAWGLNAHFPRLNVMGPTEDTEIKAAWDEFERRCPGAGLNLKPEGGKFQLLYALFEMEQHRLGEAFQDWLKAHQLLRWFQDLYVDSKRHRLVHGSVQLQEELFDQIFRDALEEWGANGISVPSGQGPWLLLGLTYRSFAKLPDADGSHLVRELAAAAWETLARGVPSAPAAPAWVEWDSQLDHSRIVGFERQLQRAFSSKIEEMQGECENLVAQWKRDIERDIKNSGFPQTKQLLEKLKRYEVPQWGYHLAQGFINLQQREREIKFEILASLHPSFDFRTRADVKTYLGQYLSGNHTFKQLFAELNPSKKRSQPKTGKARRPRRSKGGSGPKLGDVARIKRHPSKKS